MVDFAMDDETRMIVQALGDFIEREVKPYEKKLGHVLRDERLMLTPDGLLHPDIVAAVKDLRAKSAAAGFYAMHMPAEEGGGGVPKTGVFHAWKEVMRHGLSLNLAILSFVEGPSPLFLQMTPAQKEKWLAPLVRGEKTSAFCLTEPEAGSDVGSIRTTAVRDGDEFVLNGTKTFVTNGPYADFLQVFAKTDPAAGIGGISCFIVPRDAPGLRMGGVQQSILNDGGQCEFVFEDCRVPSENLVGEENMGFYLAIGNIGDTRVTIGAQCVGLMEFCIDAMVEYAKQRTAFGKPIGKLGQIQAMVADSAMDLTAAELITLKTCWMIDRGMDVIRESSMTKVFTTEALFRVADRAIQVHGGTGLMREMPLERIFRFARVVRIPEGTSEIQRWTIAKTYGL